MSGDKDTAKMPLNHSVWFAEEGFERERIRSTLVRVAKRNRTKVFLQPPILNGNGWSGMYLEPEDAIKIGVALIRSATNIIREMQDEES
jgi:hypothetical protein